MLLPPNDGYADIFLSHKKGLNVFLENAGRKVFGNTYISFRLQGTVSNFEAIGTTLVLTMLDGRVQLREHNAESFEADAHGSREPRIIFGLGKAGIPMSLEVRWPSGVTTTLSQAELEAVPRTMNFNDMMTLVEPRSGN